MEMSGQLYAEPLHRQGKKPWYPLYRRMGGPHSRSGHGGEEKNFQPLPGLEPPIIQSAAQLYTTELSRILLFSGIQFILSATETHQFMYILGIYVCAV
jgi:hypothetical protein